MHRTFALITLMSSVLTGGCADDTQAPGTPPPAPTVHVHSAGEAGIYVNAFLIETQNGVVAIDSMLTVSDAKALRNDLDALGKPLLAVLLTHGHPDHYNGVGELTRDLDVPVVATAAVDQVIRDDDAAKEAQWKPVFGDEWPDNRVFPSQIVVDGETLQYDGVAFTVHELGPGESHADSYWVLEGDSPAVFLGDTVFHDVHSYMADGHSHEWLDNLDLLDQSLTANTTLYVGHGPSGDLSLLQEQRAYIELYRNTVQSLAMGAPTLNDDAKMSLEATMMDHLPSDKLSFLIALGADAIAAELASETP